MTEKQPDPINSVNVGKTKSLQVTFCAVVIRRDFDHQERAERNKSRAPVENSSRFLRSLRSGHRRIAQKSEERITATPHRLSMKSTKAAAPLALRAIIGIASFERRC
jgi:hypothetical protein